MITGVVTEEWEATLAVTVRAVAGRGEGVETAVDTGFNGFLTLPDSMIASLGLPYHSRTVVTLADGSQVALRQYEASVLWDGTERDVLVLEADGGPLTGMALLRGSRLTLDVEIGGAVIVEPLPQTP